MKLVTGLKTILVLLAVVVLNSVSLAGHSMTMSSSAHDTKTMNHGVADSVSCVTLCRTAVVNKEETNLKRDEEENDNNPPTPYYLQQQLHTQLDAKSTSKRSYAANVKPPPKIPIYILYGVFRA